MREHPKQDSGTVRESFPSKKDAYAQRATTRDGDSGSNAKVRNKQFTWHYSIHPSRVPDESQNGPNSEVAFEYYITPMMFVHFQ